MMTEKQIRLWEAKNAAFRAWQDAVDLAEKARAEAGPGAEDPEGTEAYAAEMTRREDVAREAYNRAIQDCDEG